MTGYGLAELLAESDRRDRELAARLSARRHGYTAGYDAGHAGGYAAGYEQAVRDWKVTAGLLRLDGTPYAELAERRWGPDGREHFAGPQPGDYPGGAEGLAGVRASWLAQGLGLGPGPGWVHLSGAVVHYGHHPCKPACHAYKPGWYTPAEAAGILARLPGDYAETIAELRAMAPAPGRRAAA